MDNWHWHCSDWLTATNQHLHSSLGGWVLFVDFPNPILDSFVVVFSSSKVLSLIMNTNSMLILYYLIRKKWIFYFPKPKAWSLKCLPLLWKVTFASLFSRLHSYQYLKVLQLKKKKLRQIMKNSFLFVEKMPKNYYKIKNRKKQVTHSPPRGTLDKNAASSASGCAALAKELSSRWEYWQNKKVS